MIRIAICDDNTTESELLQLLLHEYANMHNVDFQMEIFTSGFLFLDAIKKQFHICFLDIFMPEFSGVDTAKELRTMDRETHLIFHSSSKDFALDGYAVQASNYLLKPVDKNLLFSALDEIMRKIYKDKTQNFCVPSLEGLRLVSPDNIAYITPTSNHSTIHLYDSKIIISRMPFSQMVENLEQHECFSLISRSVLLNYSAVVGMEKDNFLLVTGVKIAIPRRRKKEITQEFLDYTLAK